MDEVEHLLEAGQFEAVITALEGQARTGREFTVLGLALIRSGRLIEAELPLTRASILGDLEGMVELGNTLRLLGRFEEALSHLKSIAGELTGELQLRAMRWEGVTEFQLGSSETGLQRVERAWHGYMALGNEELLAGVSVSLARMYQTIGNTARATLLLREALRSLPLEPYPSARLTALRALLDLYIAHGQFTEAQSVLDDAKAILGHLRVPRQQLLLLTSEAELTRLTGHYARYSEILEELGPLAEQSGDYNLRVWQASRLAEHYSFMGLHGRALEALLRLGLTRLEWPAEFWVTDGIIVRRRGDYATAEASLEKAVSLYRSRGDMPGLIRASLHLAAAAVSVHHEELAVSALREGLSEMLRLRQLHEFRPDLEELSELLNFALLEPDLAPYMDSVMDNLSSVAGHVRLPEDGAMLLNVSTLGKVMVERDKQPISFSMHGAPLLLVYIYLNPGRTRADIQLALFPDKEPKAASNYVRQAIKELRDKLGHDAVIFEGPHSAPWYRLGRLVHVELDLVHFHDAISRGETSRALSLYRGEFMPRFDSEWVEGQREEALLALTSELRVQMTRYKAEGDFRRFILLANQYLRADPYDREVLEARVEAAKIVANQKELARYVSELKRVYD